MLTIAGCHCLITATAEPPIRPRARAIASSVRVPAVGDEAAPGLLFCGCCAVAGTAAFTRTYATLVLAFGTRWGPSRRKPILPVVGRESVARAIDGSTTAALRGPQSKSDQPHNRK